MAMDPGAPATNKPAGTRTLRILVVDDDELDRRAVRRCLLQAGIAATIDEARSAAEAVERFQPGAYDCVVLDYYIPGVEHLSLLRQLQTTARDIPVVILTGRGDEEIAVEFMKAGAVDYLSKGSMTPERLATSCRYAVEMAREAATRRDVEQALRERETEFRTLANAIPQMAWMADSEGRRYWYNDRWYEFTGLRPDESLGLGWRLVHHPDHRARVCDGQEAAFARGESWEDTFPLKRKDGVYRWFLARAVPFRTEDGSTARWFGTHTDITERLETERALAASEERLRSVLAHEQAARQDAERATKARDDVIAIVAHDLRNPMHAIVGAASMLGISAEDDKRRRQVAIIQRSAQEMERLIAGLLDVARIEEGTLAIRNEPIDLRALIDATLEQFEGRALERKIALRCDINDSLPPVAGDRDRLVQVLSNLLGNALKFTPEGQGISVRATPLEGAVQVSVKDSGAGIPQEHLPHIFDRFWQANRQSRSGAGLGLAICKGIVEAHGGRIWAASSVGRGTTIHFTLWHATADVALDEPHGAA
jgi:PAS domain S-box-containing protein